MQVTVFLFDHRASGVRQWLRQEMSQISGLGEKGLKLLYLQGFGLEVLELGKG